MDAVERIEEYWESVEEYFSSSLSAATTDLPNIHEAVNKLWLDISRYGPPIPSFPEMHIPVLGDFQVPPPLPPLPPPPHSSWLSKSANWTCQHPWTMSGIALGVIGTSLMVGYRNAHERRRNQQYRVKSQSNDRREVVVVLGGDAPLALPLILNLEEKGYIVIASVSTPEAVQVLEQQCQGYVRALVLDPHEPATTSVFLRSLTSTLSRKFPITASGDPYASPSSHPYIQSVICLSTLSTLVPSAYAPLEHISLRNTYLPYLSATHITPLQVLQALMPLLRTGPARTRDKGKKTVIVCLPAIEACVGLPFASIQAMSAAATLRGIEVLRREINLAALTDQSESMKNVKVVIANVGALDVETVTDQSPQEESTSRDMEDWTPSEKLIYGPPFASICQAAHPSTSPWATVSAIFRNDPCRGITRKPTDINVFVDNIVSVVTGGRHKSYLFGLGHRVGQIQNWIRGDRFSIGAGAKTYRVASYLPSIVLESLLNIPYFLISVRNRLLPAQPFITPETGSVPVPVTSKSDNNTSIEPSETESGHDISETSSEVDIESNLSESGDNWIRLRKSRDPGPPATNATAEL